MCAPHLRKQVTGSAWGFGTSKRFADAFAKNTAFNKNFGTTAGTVAEGNHGHSNYALSNHSHANEYAPGMLTASACARAYVHACAHAYACARACARAYVPLVTSKPPFPLRQIAYSCSPDEAIAASSEGSTSKRSVRA